MSCALGKSNMVGLLLAAFTLVFASCQHLDLSKTGRAGVAHASTKRIKLLVEEDGIFAVSLRDLAQSGLAIDELSLSDVNLSQGGLAVPHLIQDERLIFYGQGPQNRYTNVRPYILEIGQHGVSIQAANIPNQSTPQIHHVPQIIHLEENHVYKPEARVTEESDVWFWAELSQGKTFDIQIDLPNLYESPAHFRIGSWGFTDLPDINEDHDFDIQLNDETVGQVVWDGQTYHIGEISLPLNSLNQGLNKITLDNRPEGASFLDIVHINWIEIVYEAPAVAVNDQLTFSSVEGLVHMSGFSDTPMIFNISDPTAPKMLKGWENVNGQVKLPVEKDMTITAIGPEGFKTPAIQELESLPESDLRDPKRQADLLIVTTDELAPALAPLIKSREEQGLSVALVLLETVYDEFGYGERSPEVIRQFVAYAYSNWQKPRPKYLFLVGDATTDFHRNLSGGPANEIPSLLVPVQFGGETVSDARLVDVDGDQRPELAVGRWPVRTKQEVENLVSRTLQYEEGPSGSKAIFVSDDSEERFDNVVERITNKSRFSNEQVRHLKGGEMADIAEQLNSGTWLATYVGHGSIKRWGKDNIFDREAAADLRSNTPPIIVQLTCLTGLFAHPDETSLVEVMLTQPGGPVLSVAATSLSLSSHQEPFAIQLLQRLQDPNIVRMGDAFQEAKLSLAIDTSDGFREISDTFTLFGDPTTRIVRP